MAIPRSELNDVADGPSVVDAAYPWTTEYVADGRIHEVPAYRAACGHCHEWGDAHLDAAEAGKWLYSHECKWQEKTLAERGIDTMPITFNKPV